MEVNFERKDLKNLRNPQKRVEQNRIHQKKHYQSHKKYYKDKAKARKERLLEFIRDYKERKGCKECNLKDRRCLDFHHPEDNKEFEVSNMARRGLSLERIKKEMEKCDVLCKNCHAIKHYE